MLKKKISLKEKTPITTIKEEQESEVEEKAPISSSKVVGSEKRFRSYLRIRPFDGVNKSFSKTLQDKNYGSKLTLNKSLFHPSLLKEFGSEFNFESIFEEDYTQLEIFQETCVPLIQSLISNKKSSVLLVQGLNDSGKTFSIIGDTENPGILPLSLRLIYDKIKDFPEGQVKILCNFFEIFDSNAYDLLSSEKKQVDVPFRKYSNIIHNATFFPLDKIQDFSNALNQANRRKKMQGGTSLSNTVFKLILRFYDEKRNNYEERSYTIIDTAFPVEKDFINLNKCDSEFTSGKENKKEGLNLYSLQQSLCKLVALAKTKISKTSKLPFHFSPLTQFLKYYFYSDEDIVLITNVKPKLELNEDNLKVLYFSLNFKNLVNQVDSRQKSIKYKVNNKFKVSDEIAIIHTNNNKRTEGYSSSFVKSRNQNKAGKTKQEKEFTSEKSTTYFNSKLSEQTSETLHSESSDEDSSEIKREYEELKIKFKEQEQLLNILKQEKVPESQFVNRENEASLKFLNLPAEELDIENITSRLKHFNVVMLNPTIQHLTIATRGEKEESLSKLESGSKKLVGVTTPLVNRLRENLRNKFNKSSQQERHSDKLDPPVKEVKNKKIIDASPDDLKEELERPEENTNKKNKKPETKSEELKRNKKQIFLDSSSDSEPKKRKSKIEDEDFLPKKRKK